MRRIGTADLEARLSEHLRAVRAGEELIVMDRREPIARVIPFAAASWSSPPGDRSRTSPGRARWREAPRSTS